MLKSFNLYFKMLWEDCNRPAQVITRNRLYLVHKTKGDVQCTAVLMHISLFLIQVFNLSLPRKEIGQWNQRVLDVGWPDNLAPPLERLCSVCRALDSWLQADPQHVAVLHSKYIPFVFYLLFQRRRWHFWVGCRLERVTRATWYFCSI